MKIPKKITPSPVIEALAEFKIKINIPSSVMLGKVYEGLVAEFPKFEELPILSMPEQLRAQEPAFLNAPHYRFSNDKYLVHVGDRIISVNEICTAPGVEYSGWESLAANISSVIEIFEKGGVKVETESITLRYINFFQVDNFKDIVRITAKIGDVDLADTSNFTVNLDVKGKDITQRITVGSESMISTLEGKQEKGQTIGLEAIFRGDVEISKWSDELEKLHSSMDNLFFGVVTEEYVKGLNPEY